MGIAGYEALPFNSKNLYDIILRDVDVRFHEGTPHVRADIGINLEEVMQGNGGHHLMAKVVDAGDLSSYGAFDDRDGKMVSVQGGDIQFDALIPWEKLQRQLGLLK